MARAATPPKPRKTPVQARSAATVEAICEACIQVLLAGGLERMTTTRVAERAGVSIGSLYQYFPNKQALLAVVLERHLVGVVEAVEQACERTTGARLAEIACAVAQAFMDAKFKKPEASVALYAVASEVGGAQAVQRLARRGQAALATALGTASDRRLKNPDVAAFVLSTALAGPVQNLLASYANDHFTATVREHLVALAASYIAHEAV